MKNSKLQFLNNIPYPPLIIACLTLGLAPFTPQPHLVEKIRLLFTGDLARPIDIFDLAFHALPWLLFIVKLMIDALQRSGKWT